MWLHPSFFCIEIEQFGHFFELVTSHKQFAAISSSSSVPTHTINTTLAGIAQQIQNNEPQARQYQEYDEGASTPPQAPVHNSSGYNQYFEQHYAGQQQGTDPTTIQQKEEVSTPPDYGSDGSGNGSQNEGGSSTENPP